MADDNKKGVVAVVKEKANGLVAYNEKDLAKLKAKVEKLEMEYKIHDLAYRYLSDPQNEDLIKEVNGLDEKSKKALTKIANAKKVRLAIVAGSVVVIGAVAGVALKNGSKKTTTDAIDVEAEEVESDEDEAYEDVDENLEEDSDEESTEE